MGPWGNLRGLHGALVSRASQLHGTLGGSVGLHGTPSGFDAGVPHSFEELCESLRPEMPERSPCLNLGPVLLLDLLRGEEVILRKKKNCCETPTILKGYFSNSYISSLLCEPSC